MGQSKHDKIAERLAKKFGTEYNKAKGPDVKAKKIIEVATHESDLHTSIKQLKGFKKPKYLATTPELVKKAKEITKGTKIGVMGPTGHIKKRASGKK